MRDDDHTYNAMHSAEPSNGCPTIQNRHNQAVHGLERLPSIADAGHAGLPVQSLYVGSRNGKAFPDVDRQAVVEIVTERFDCFTVVDADGHFIKIATGDAASVEALGHDLGELLEQQAVGLETAGYYKSIAMR